MFDHTDMYGMGTSCGDAEREVGRLRDELTEANRRVNVLMFGDASMQSRIWLNEECARLKAERDRARTAVHRYFGHAGEVEACTVGICHAIVRPAAPMPRFDPGNPYGWSPGEIRQGEESQAMFESVDDEAGRPTPAQEATAAAIGGVVVPRAFERMVSEALRAFDGPDAVACGPDEIREVPDA